MNGEKITIKASGEEAAIGDEVVKEDGSPVEDGEVIVDLGEEGKIILVIKDGKIAEFKEYTEEVEVQDQRLRTNSRNACRLLKSRWVRSRQCCHVRQKLLSCRNAMTLASQNSLLMTKLNCRKTRDADKRMKPCRNIAAKSS